MHKLGFAVAVLFTTTLSAQVQGPDWVKVTEAAGWQARDSQGEVVFNDRMWLFGGWFDSWEAPPRDVWSSADGQTWDLVLKPDQKEPGWGHSDLAFSLTFKGKMYFMGGWFNGRLPGHSSSNAVWSSTDGVKWDKVTEHAGWTPRISAAVADFKGQMWVLGGNEDYYFGDESTLRNDVWSSTDGKHWTLVAEHAPWSPRVYHQSAVLDGKLYVYGGGNYVPNYLAYNDVWVTEDGEHWEECTSAAPWPPRIWFSSAVYRDLMWVIGGAHSPSGSWENLGDVWFSKNGKDWTQLKSNVTWKERHEHSVYVHQDKLWVAGGHAKPLSSEVWSLELPADFGK